MEYEEIIVESFIPTTRENSHNKVRIRPAFDQGVFKTTMRVQCSRDLRKDYPVGTRFRIRAKLIRSGDTEYISSHYTWDYEVLGSDF